MGVRFSDANMFGFPQRIWREFADQDAVLQLLGEAEVRARLQFREPGLIDEQAALSALECAEWLLQLELADEARVQMVRDGHDLQREIDIELAEMEELMRD